MFKGEIPLNSGLVGDNGSTIDMTTVRARTKEHVGGLALSF